MDRFFNTCADDNCVDVYLQTSDFSVKGQYIGLGADRAFMPYSGHRNLNTGAVAHQGSTGAYWSSSVRSSANGYRLGLDLFNVYPESYDNQAFGFPVRCVPKNP